MQTQDSVMLSCAYKLYIASWVFSFYLSNWQMMQVCVCLIYDGLQVIQTNIDGALEYRSFSLVVTVALASRSLGPKSCLSPSNCCRK
jgi:hypothetical protein